MGLAAFNRMRRQRAAEAEKAQQTSEDASTETKSAERDIDALRAQYEARFGEKPHPHMKESTLRKKLSEADDADTE
jgi:hypothetical protein